MLSYLNAINSLQFLEKRRMSLNKLILKLRFSLLLKYLLRIAVSGELITICETGLAKYKDPFLL